MPSWLDCNSPASRRLTLAQIATRQELSQQGVSACESGQRRMRILMLASR